MDFTNIEKKLNADIQVAEFTKVVNGQEEKVSIVKDEE